MLCYALRDHQITAFKIFALTGKEFGVYCKTSMAGGSENKSKAMSTRNKPCTSQASTDDCSNAVSLEDLELKMDKWFSSLQNQIGTSTNTLRDEIKATNSELSIKISGIKKQVDGLGNKMENELEILKKNFEVVLTGVPYKMDENLHHIFKAVCSSVDIKDSLDADIFRLNTSGANSVSIIIIRFATVFHKDLFMRNYYKVAKTLNLSCIPGYSGVNRIYLQHNLSTLTYQIKKAALQLLRTGKISNMKIINGKIAVQFIKKGKFIICECLDDLNKTNSE